jgi:peptidoglycan/LPS O-acetylase OafA/YrhL
MYLGHFWSLAVEEQFYLLWPLTVWLLPRRAILWLSISFVGLSELIRLVWLHHSGIQFAISFATVTRMDGLFVGAICAYLFRQPNTLQKLAKYLPWIVAVGFGTFFTAYTLVIFSPILFHHVPLGVNSQETASLWVAQYGGYSAVSIGAGALLLFITSTLNQRSLLQSILQSRILSSIGKYSYGIYIFHFPILGLGDAFLVPLIKKGNPESPMLFVLAYITVVSVVTYLVAAFSYEMFERKILSFKRFFEPRYIPFKEEKEEKGAYSIT